MIEKQVPIDQTQFSFEEPIFEDQAVFAEEKLIVPEEDKPKNNKKTFLIAGVIGFFILILLLILIIFKNRVPKVVPIEEENQPTTITEVGPLQERVNDARDLLDLADPTKQDLSFPPVDMEIRLDPKVK